MRVRPYIWLGLITIIVFLGILMLKHPRATLSDAVLATTNLPDAASTNSTVANPTPTSVSDTNAPSGATNLTGAYNQGPVGKDEAVRETMVEKNKQVLDLYGQVIDQYGQPVVGADVEGSVLLNVSSVPSGTEIYISRRN